MPAADTATPLEFPANVSGILQGIAEASDGRDVVIVGASSELATAHEHARVVAQSIGFLNVAPPAGAFAAIILRGTFAQVTFRLDNGGIDARAV